MRVAVYCSANNRIPDEYLALGDAVGSWLARNGYSLVFGGATGGLMTRVSEAFAKNMTNNANQKLIGVVTKKIARSGRKSKICTDLCLVSDMCERKRLMRLTADCFVCLPGSYGTLDEMFDAISGGTVGEHKKPMVILNYNGFYDSLRAQTALMKQLCFLPEQEHYTPHYADTLEQLFDMLEAFRAKEYHCE